MINIRTASTRGHADHGWLKSWHSFSFADYYDPTEMGWGALRVINEDIVAPGQGFPMHGHRDMEIITVVLAGALEHRDSLGNGAVIRPGEVQRMSAGTGVRHSEFNPSATQPTHLLQIWIVPGKLGGVPGYEQAPAAHADGWQLLAAPPAQGAAVAIHQNARLLRLRLSPGEHAEQVLAPGRLGYVHVISGLPTLNGVSLSIGDGAKVADEERLHFSADTAADLLLFDLPA